MKRLLAQGMLSLLGFFSSLVILGIPVSMAAENQKVALQAKVTFHDGTVVQVSEPRLIYYWIRQSDRRYFNPPVNEEKSMSIWLEMKNHGMTEKHEVPLRDLERLEMKFERPGDTCKMVATVVEKSGKRFTIAKEVNDGIPGTLEKQVPDPSFQSLQWAGVVPSRGNLNKFMVKLWGYGICPEAKEVVKEVIFTSGN